MRADIWRLCGWGLVLLVALWSEEASGLIVYRYGGESLPPPLEVGQEGVKFVQRSWSAVDVAQGGETYRLDVDEEAIRALRYDPQVNIVPAAREAGATVVRENTNGTVFDGDLNTVWVVERYLCAEMRGFGHMGSCYGDFAQPGDASIDFALPYLIDRIRITSGLDDPTTIARNIYIYLAPVAPKYSYYGLQPLRPVTIEVRNNHKPVLDIPIPPLEESAFLQVMVSEHRDPIVLHEIEVFAKGFADKSTYVSNILDFGEPAAWGELRWAGRKDRGAEVFIQTRSGKDDDPTLYWRYTGRGDEKEEVTRTEYERLKPGERADITYDRDGWTFWSAPYDFADSLGTPVVSLSPRRYLQFKVNFLPQSFSGGEVRFLEVRASVPPLTTELVGEVFPTRVDVGQESRFTYALRPTMQGDDTGFDRLEMTTSSILKKIHAMRIGDVEVPFEKQMLAEHRLEVSFPKLQQKDSGVLLEVEFEAQVLRYGATFDVRVFDSDRPLEVSQWVSAGNATDEFEGNQVSVMTSAGARSLLEASVSPKTFTPNGDGVNDVAEVSYDLLEITGFGAVRVEVRDLAGHLVRTVYIGEAPIGRYARPWDGTDEAGKVVPPGVYLYCVSVDADEEQIDRIGTVRVSY